MKADEAASNHGVRSGTLETIWRYPIKSAGGEKLDQALINKRGLEGDRLFAVYHENGKPGSNKTNQRFQKTNQFSMSRLNLITALLCCFCPTAT